MCYDMTAGEKDGHFTIGDCAVEHSYERSLLVILIRISREGEVN